MLFLLSYQPASSRVPSVEGDCKPFHCLCLRESAGARRGARQQELGAGVRSDRSRPLALLARLASVQEYGFVLGYRLRKETPVLKDPARHNGWVIVPQRKLEQKETRAFDAERQKLCAKIIKEHPGTPWEILARREQATILGVTLQEAKLKE